MFQKKPKTKAVSTTPGPLNQLTQKTYIERGSMQAVDKRMWQYVATFSLLAAMIEGIAIVSMLPLQKVNVVTVAKVENSGGRVITENASNAYKPDREAIGSFLNGWAENVFDINNAIWKRNIDRAAKIVSGTALDQLRTLVGRDDFNGVYLISQQPKYVRTYEAISINFIKDDVVLIRFKLTSRPMPGVAAEIKYYALTINYSTNKPRTEEEALWNPGGIYVTSFNLSQEAVQNENKQ